MKERPILFNGPMVRAILEGRKTQTRRLINFETVGNNYGANRDCYNAVGYQTITDHSIAVIPWTHISLKWLLRCPYGQVGDRLWVKETHIRHPYWTIYRADLDPVEAAGIGGMYGGWTPSIHMLRKHSRITLEITDVRVQRLQEISEEDAIAEGIQVLPLQSESDSSAWYQSAPGVHQARTARGSYMQLWDSIYAKRGVGWIVNPWVWAVTFKEVQP
jgi:hypothetical protein